MGRKSIQATFDSIRNKVEDKSGELIKEKFEGLADLTIYTAVLDKAIDTGAYVTSFSIGPAGFGGGRSRTSNNKPRHQDPVAMKATARSQLQSDINAIDFKGLLSTGKFRATLRNRAPHSDVVEKKYHVFTTIRREAT